MEPIPKPPDISEDVKQIAQPATRGLIKNQQWMIGVLIILLGGAWFWGKNVNASAVTRLEKQVDGLAKQLTDCNIKSDTTAIQQAASRARLLARLDKANAKADSIGKAFFDYILAEGKLKDEILEKQDKSYKILKTAK